MSVLTAAVRDALPDSAFAIPERRAYPIHDRRHAANALARVAQYGTPEEKARVIAAVRKRYPDMGRSQEGDILESAAGGSMGGHDPRAFGKIRYIVRAFGTWAGGKHHICVKRLMAEHPEVAPTTERANALCAWLKDQWAGTTKWRGKGSNPKQKAEDLRIEAAAQAKNAALRAMEGWWPDQDDVDALYRRFMEMGFTVDDALTEALAELPHSHDKQLIEQQVNWAGIDPPEQTLALLEQVEDLLNPALREEYLKECGTGGYGLRRKKRLKKMAAAKKLMT